MRTALETDAIVEETARWFAERKWLMSRDEGPRQRRNHHRAETLRRFSEHREEGTAEAWIAEMVEATLKGRANFDAVLRDIGARFVVDGVPVPPVLRAYIRKVLEGTFPPAKPSRRASDRDNYSRDILIAHRVRFIAERYGFAPTRNHESMQDCASSLVADALAKPNVRMAIGVQAVQSIWKKYKAVVSA